MRAMRAKAHDVLHEHLIVGVRLRAVAANLKTHTAELAVRPVEHETCASRRVAEGIEQRGIHTRRAVVRAQLVVTQAHSPLRHKLIYRLHIPTGLRGAVRVAHRRTQYRIHVGGKLAVLPAPQILGLNLEIGARGVAVR